MTALPTTAELPEGRYIELPGRGTTFIRELPRPLGSNAPTLLLLHGWTATADLNWHAAYRALAGRYHVIALDHRGHARGIRADGHFSLEDCADDAAALIEELGLRSVIPVGYSMGGPIAQLLWQRHPHLVDGLVLCATSRTFNGTPRERMLFSLLSGCSVGAKHLRMERRTALAMRLMGRRNVDPTTWAHASESLLSHDWLAIIDAGRALGRFDSRSWIGDVFVPTAVVVTTRDRVVPAMRQYELAFSIPGATVHPVDGDHAVCLAHGDLFVPQLIEAVDTVAERAHPALLAA
jgi:pimeloyl-ACP methyl ester carboxylesterase